MDNQSSSYKIVDFDSWKDFRNFLDENTGLPGYIFRGQNQAGWELTPSINRIKKEVNRGHILHRYKMYTRGRSTIPFNETSFEHWAIGQHHKLKTPLLDWTVSPYVAAYFAFNEVRKVDLPKELKSEDQKTFLDKCNSIIMDKCAIFALNTIAIKDILHSTMTDEAIKAIPEEFPTDKPSVNYDLDNIYETAKDPSEYFRQIREYFQEDEEKLGEYSNTAHSFSVAECKFNDFPIEIFSPKNASNRLLNQRGLFTYWQLSESMDNWFNKLISTKAVLVKYTLPVNEKTNILNDLNAMNINQLSLFPDLDGAGEYCNSRVIDNQ